MEAALVLLLGILMEAALDLLLDVTRHHGLRTLTGERRRHVLDGSQTDTLGKLSHDLPGSQRERERSGVCTDWTFQSLGINIPALSLPDLIPVHLTSIEIY